MIPWLGHDRPGHPLQAFPPVDHALCDPNGLLCAGGGLSPERLLAAYRRGIFPWFSEGEPVLWWSPDPRMVLFPSEFRCSRSLRRELKKPGYFIRRDHDFAAVIDACASTPRRDQDGTWIVDEMRQAYLRLHRLGWAHSLEVWEAFATGEVLIGGLYGIAIGRMFFGESMFSRKTNASKIAIAHLVRYLEEHGFGMIDCQVRTEHLASLGGREIPRAEFLARLEHLCDAPAVAWQ
jgi:leucyl/phenylalanyl-tRNA--protein transferase